MFRLDSILSPECADADEVVLYIVDMSGIQYVADEREAEKLVRHGYDVVRTTWERR